MKPLIQRIALIGFFGCVALIGIAGHNKHMERCNEEWKAGFSNNSQVVKKINDSVLFSPAGVLNFVWQ